MYADFDYVALGHVHRPQRVGRDTVRYSGSPLKYSFSEARYDKSAVLVEIGVKPDGVPVGECVDVQLVPLEPLHDLREVRCSLAEATAQAASTEDYVHITLTDEKPQLDAVARVRDVFPNVMALDYEFATALVPRTCVREALDPDEMDIVSLFKAFYQEQTGSVINEDQEKLLRQFAYPAEGCRQEGGDAR